MQYYWNKGSGKCWIKRFFSMSTHSENETRYIPGADPGGGVRHPPKIGKNKIFWRKIVIFHRKYPKNCRASLRSAQFFLSAPPP